MSNKLTSIVAGITIPVLVAVSGCRPLLDYGKPEASGKKYTNMRGAPQEQIKEIRELGIDLQKTDDLIALKDSYYLFMSIGDFDNAKKALDFYKTKNPRRWLELLKDFNKEKERYSNQN